jgi:3-oxoacyl-[acyl-carrier-protein] synthase II
LNSASYYITGVGAVNQLGVNAEDIYKKCIEGRVNFSEIDSVDGLPLRNRVSVGKIDSDVIGNLSSDFPNMSLNLKLGYQAAKEALYDAYPNGDFPNDMGLIIANNDANTDVVAHNIGESESIFDHLAGANTILDFIKKSFKFEGYSVVVHNTCASFNAALDIAMELIGRGVHSSVLVGGVDMLSSKVIFGFDTLRALSLNPSRPFCKDRGTITISEGAAFVLVENKKLNTYCEILAVARNNDAAHPTSPTEKTVEECQKNILNKAGINGSDVRIVVAHGTGTKINDAIESNVSRKNIPSALLIATKAQLGHTMAACGAMNAVIISKSYAHSIFPGNIIKRNQIEYDLNWPDSNVGISEADIIQSNSFGFGGNNAIAMFRGVK